MNTSLDIVARIVSLNDDIPVEIVEELELYKYYYMLDTDTPLYVYSRTRMDPTYSLDIPNKYGLEDELISHAARTVAYVLALGKPVFDKTGYILASLLYMGKYDMVKEWLKAFTHLQIDLIRSGDKYLKYVTIPVGCIREFAEENPDKLVSIMQVLQPSLDQVLADYLTPDELNWYIEKVPVPSRLSIWYKPSLNPDYDNKQNKIDIMSMEEDLSSLYRMLEGYLLEYGDDTWDIWFYNFRDLPENAEGLPRIVALLHAIYSHSNISQYREFDILNTV